MNALGRRIARLEAEQSVNEVIREPVLLTLAGKTEDDVIGVGTSSKTIARMPGETLAALVARAHPLLAEPWSIGLPIILCCVYADDEMEIAQ